MHHKMGLGSKPGGGVCRGGGVGGSFVRVHIAFQMGEASTEPLHIEGSRFVRKGSHHEPRNV